MDFRVSITLIYLFLLLSCEGIHSRCTKPVLVVAWELTHADGRNLLRAAG